MPESIHVKNMLTNEKYKIDHVCRGDVHLGSVSQRRLDDGDWTPWTAAITEDIIGKYPRHKDAVEAVVRAKEGGGVRADS